MDLEALPEGCIAEVIGMTTPADACRLSLISRHFKSAADSDTVWDKFLPAETNEILLHFESATDAKSKKELYLTLSDNPILIDRNMSFSLEKWSGKKSYMIAARRLRIAWGNDPVCWNWKSLPKSRFKEALKLISFGLFDIRGRIETRILSPSTTYKAYLVYRSTGVNYAATLTAVVARASGFDYDDEDLGMREINKHFNFSAVLGQQTLLEERLARKEIMKYTEFPNERRVDGWL
uniref:putative F-box protein PP2-B8 n=1 Tax=Fragaria vesca subsp. vesca TaxID=101020 RepID=UPI0005C9730A|nr:PREDICTED: putative F-box protein PP2-B8 [Fragaria vesca subsp. vesca]